jgi:hypothetical protein
MSKNFELMQQQATPILQPPSVASKPQPDAHRNEIRLDLDPAPREEKIGVVRRILSLFGKQHELSAGNARDNSQTSSFSSALEKERWKPSRDMASANLRVASTSDGRKLSVYSLVRRP